MNEIYKPKNFKIFELVDPVTYEKYGQFAWQFLDAREMWVLHNMRLVFGPATINDWKWNSNSKTNFKWSGLRPPYCRVGSKWSQHRHGRSTDKKFKKADSEEVRQWLIKNQYMTRHSEWIKYISVIEKGTKTWVHSDVRAKNWKGIRLVNG